MKIRAFAKINLSLDIVGKREDGYHLISSVMQSVSLYDDIKIEKTDEGISVACSDKTITGGDNLGLRAAELFFFASGIKGGAEIYIEKNIPLAAGLGGGSADAAAVLTGLNRLYGEPLSLNSLSDIALKLGADVPFCLKGGTALAEGIGERLTYHGGFPKLSIVIAKKGVKSSTAAMYKALDSVASFGHPMNDRFIAEISNGNIEKALSYAYNCFEQVTDAADEAKEIMNEYMPLYVGLSGAGPSVIGVFKNTNNAKKCEKALIENGYFAAVCRPTDSANIIIE